MFTIDTRSGAYRQLGVDLVAVDVVGHVLDLGIVGLVHRSGGGSMLERGHG